MRFVRLSSCASLSALSLPTRSREGEGQILPHAMRSSRHEWLSGVSLPDIMTSVRDFPAACSTCILTNDTPMVYVPACALGVVKFLELYFHWWRMQV